MSQACPICKRPAVPAYAPFCSKRCADVDLQRWFAGVYRVPGEEQPDATPPPGEDEG
jgi:endogenous inhibitor of DNA gyrase (YacG/DUF329 family)